MCIRSNLADSDLEVGQLPDQAQFLHVWRLEHDLSFVSDGNGHNVICTLCHQGVGTIWLQS